LSKPGQAESLPPADLPPGPKIVVSYEALRAAARLINTWDDRSDASYDLKALVREVLVCVLGDRVTFGS
jgi:hypothetical protein